MEFAFSDEQEMIRESAESFLADVSDSAAVRAAMATELGHDPELWKRLCNEMVWPAIHIPEQYGGLGLGFVELAILLEQMGRRLFCSPFFASACLATPALLLGGSEEQKACWLPQLADGSLTATLAFASNNRNGLDAVQASYRVEGSGFVIDGCLRQVVDGHSAGLLIVAARGRQGIGLFAVPAETPGVHRRFTPTLDQTRKLAEVEFSQVYLPAEAHLGEPGQGGELLEQVLQLACVALAAEQVGGAQQALDLTLAYTAERQQFGRAIASFQAIKHRAADMMLEVECARSAVLYAACVAEETLAPNGDKGVAAELPLAAALAKSRCSEAFFHCAAESIQLHGGVGFTWEYDPHLYFKRARASEALFGAPSWHRERIAAALLGEIV
ncbi:acyl-CoA dehydrogenase family protein [Pseudomonas sp. OTU5201]|uniref:acyl-CoA dehydrogenase family protein n=1 Tax=Pseudomonas sp. OTU5201 TaxID=3043850 RepID=UPI00313E9485